ncbi:MAG: hypothetical protein PVF95_11980 [bacterium]|jgi:hypothetical protein
MTRVRTFVLILVLMVVFIAGGTSAAAAAELQKQNYQIMEDYGGPSGYDCYMQYYYYIPCPTYSWFWGISSEGRDTYGVFFKVGDVSMGTGQPCEEQLCFELIAFRVLDFAGYGTVYPGLYTVRFDVWCSDADGCPVGPPVWTDESYETAYGWNYVDLWGNITDCATEYDPFAAARFLITATEVGSDAMYPAWGFDNVSDGYEAGCEMHDVSSYPALYPRPYTSHYETMHTGYYGYGFEYCPPLWVADGRDTTPACDEYGCIELAWRPYFYCYGPAQSEPTTWGTIKSMYR